MIKGKFSLIDEHYFHEAVDRLFTALLNSQKGTYDFLVSLKFLFFLLVMIGPAATRVGSFTRTRTRARTTPVLL
jgi:hypothetical protein